MTTRLGQLTLIITIIAVGYFVFSAVQGSVKTGVTFSSTGSDLETGLVGHWTFDGPDMTTATATDVSGNGNDGTLSGSPVTSIGKIGQAVEFDGSNDYVETIDHDFSTGGFTLSAWFNSTASSNGRILTKFGSGTNQIWFMLNSSGQVNGGATDGVDYNEITTTDTYNDGEWHHVMMVVDDVNLTLYIDTVQKGQQSHDNSFLTNNANWRIGANNDSTDYFDGMIDDVLIYSRALSVDEVTKLYNQGSDNKQNTTNTPTGLKSGLVGHWTFDGTDMTTATATDVSGNGNDGTRNGPIPIIGSIGQALHFDGSNDYVETADSASLDIVGDATIAAWVYSDALPSSGVDIILTKQGVSGLDAAAYQLALMSTGGLRWYHAIPSDGEIVDSTDTITAGAWYHVVAVRDVTNNIRFYINGVADSGNPHASTYTPQDHNIGVRIGRSHSPDREFDGKLDDVRIYNRTLSADEVQRLYNQGAGSKVNKTSTPTGLASGLVGHWTFDGPDMVGTTTSTDIGSGGNDGTLTNGPTPTLGKLGQALEFDGGLSYVTTAYDAALTPANFTISLWSKGDADELSALFRSAGGNGYNNGFALLQNSGGGAHLRWGDGTNPDGSLTGTNTNYTEWRHIVGTYNGSTMKLYVNGVFDKEDTSVSFSYSGTAAQEFGRSSGVEEFDGKIDDIRLYSQVLTAEEIKQLYNMGR